MPDKVVQVDGVGNVSFPDSMSDDDIAGVIKAQHPDQSPLDAGEVLKQYWGKVDPVSGAQQLAHAVENPVEAVKSYGDQNADLWNKAKTAFQNGKYGEGVRHTLSYLLNGIPGVGAALDEAGNKAGSGDVNGAIADTAALATQILAGKVGGAAVDALTEPGAVSGAASTVANAGKAAGSAVLDAAKAGGSDIAAGAAKTSAGLATLKTHSMAAELGLGAPLVRSGTNQMIQGGKAALAAGKATFAEKMASALEDALDLRPNDVEISDEPFELSGGQFPTQTPTQPKLKVESPVDTSKVPVKPISYKDSQNPDVAKNLQVGTKRTMPDGSTQVLQSVPIDDISGDPGNQIIGRVVDEYQKNGYTVHPELREGGETKYTINEGHHRILADVKNGKTNITTWVPAAAGKATFAEKMASALEDPKTAESPVDTSAVKVNEPPQAGAVPMQKPTASDFSWPGEMHGPESTEGSPTLPTHDSGIHFLPEQFKTIAQAKKALNVSAVLNKNGVSAEELAALPPDQLKGHLSELVKALGINKTGAVSDTSVNQILFQLRRLQTAVPE